MTGLNPGFENWPDPNEDPEQWYHYEYRPSGIGGPEVLVERMVMPSTAAGHEWQLYE